jgi:NADPH:quinone reductase-like Zn-dependent oxidoreductase
LAALRSSQKVVFFVAKMNEADMAVLRELLETGKVTPIVDRRYELSEIAAALRYMGEGHAQGKTVVAV